MKIWILKAITQKVISFFPFKHKLNFFFQKYITKGVMLSDTYFEDKLEHAFNHLTYAKKYIDFEQAKILELGTGWYPIIPVYLYLCGADTIYSIDIAPHVSKENFLLTLQKFEDYISKNYKSEFFKDVQIERHDVLNQIISDYQHYSLEQITDLLSVNFLITDARTIDLKDSSIDYIISNNTFEHIPEKILFDILQEFKRIIKKSGIMSHFVDMSDHFAHFDTSITIYNFLKFNNKQWNLIDNSIQPQNRMRVYDYKRIFNQLDLLILDEKKRFGNTDEILSIKLSEEFVHHDPKELAISHSHFVLKKS